MRSFSQTRSRSCLGVLFDQQVSYEKAWEAPYLLQQRLGHLDPAWIAVDFAAVEAAGSATARAAPLRQHHAAVGRPRRGASDDGVPGRRGADMG